MASERSILVPVDGSENSDRAVRHAIELVRHGYAAALHLLNVQPPLGGAIATFVPKANIDGFHHDEGEKALASAVKLCGDAGTKCTTHISVGRPGEVIAEYAKRHGVVEIVTGTRGHTGFGGVLMGSVAQDIVAHTSIPVCLVK
jgi:nucleotide-binding universal stress UspA family protein